MPPSASDFALVRGIADTRATLKTWNREPGPVVLAWLRGSLLITFGLLVAVLVIARVITPDSTPVLLPGVTADATLGSVAHVLARNSLVLALHAFACIAGFIAGSALPNEAQRYTGHWRWVHDRAGPLAIAFVICATTFSLATQAFALGDATATLSTQLNMSPVALLLGLSLHAIPELTALFLPLAAWIIASRAGDWHKLLAATFVTVAIAVPVLVVSAVVEVFVSPHVLIWLSS
jgi:hypothetical protein